MDIDEAERERRAAAQMGQHRRLSSEVRARLPWIREHLAAGHTQQQVVDVLREIGIAISVNTLRQYLYREAKADALVHSAAPPEQEIASMAPAAVPAEIAPIAPPPPPPQAAVSPPSFEDAMDPAKRAERASKYLQPKPLIRRAKPQSEN